MERPGHGLSVTLRVNPSEPIRAAPTSSIPRLTAMGPAYVHPMDPPSPRNKAMLTSRGLKGVPGVKRRYSVPRGRRMRRKKRNMLGVTWAARAAARSGHSVEYRLRTADAGVAPDGRPPLGEVSVFGSPLARVHRLAAPSSLQQVGPCALEFLSPRAPLASDSATVGVVVCFPLSYPFVINPGRRLSVGDSATRMTWHPGVQLLHKGTFSAARPEQRVLTPLKDT